MSLSHKILPAREATLPALVVLDACVLLNLHATGRIADILAALSRSVLVSSYVASETLWHCGSGTNCDGTVGREVVALEPLIRSGLISVVDLTSGEEEQFLAFAQHLGDGEAASGAIADGRKGAVATDDRKARRIFAQHAPAVITVGTSTLLREWEHKAKLPLADMAAALRAIRTGARFQPSATDDGFGWWKNIDDGV